MSKTAKIIYSALFIVFTLILLLGLIVLVTEKATHDRFFLNKTVTSFRISPDFVLFPGVAGDSVTAMVLCLRKKIKPVFTIPFFAVAAFSLFYLAVSIAMLNLDNRFFYEKSPDGKNEIIVRNYQFLTTGGGEVYVRMNPFFIRKLNSEDQKHAECFQDDYSIEWHDGSVTVDGHTYPLPER